MSIERAIAPPEIMTENVPNTGHLSTAQRAALQALTDGASKDQAATLAGRTRRTLDRWILEDPSFGSALKQSTGAAVVDAGRRLAGLLDDVIKALGNLLKHPETADHNRLRAADAVISNLIRLREFDDLEQRISVLEERLTNG